MRKLLKVFLFMLFCLVGFVSCSSDDGENGNNNNNGGSNKEFSEGWWKFENSGVVAYIKYDSEKNILRCGNSTSEYVSTPLENAKNLYKFDDDNVNKFLSKVTDENDLPSWAVGIYLDIDVDNPYRTRGDDYGLTKISDYNYKVEIAHYNLVNNRIEYNFSESLKNSGLDYSTLRFKITKILDEANVGIEYWDSSLLNNEGDDVELTENEITLHYDSYMYNGFPSIGFVHNFRPVDDGKKLSFSIEVTSTSSLVKNKLLVTTTITNKQ